jgi:CBS domain containing-hemolysin-like protein
MIVFAVFLGLFGLTLSASFSGTETAFYQIPKLRVKLDSLDGDRTARKILGFVNNTGLFVASILIGNNIANYAVSTAMVCFVGTILPNSTSIYAEIGSTLLLTPVLFVYGEMFPKYIGLNAPNTVLRFLTPFMTFCCFLFLPLTIILRGINRLLAAALGKPDIMISMSMGRRELTGILNEGKTSGILFETQHRLAEGIFNCSDRFVKDYAIPPHRFPKITTSMKPEEVLSIARNLDLLELPVYDNENGGEIGLHAEQALPIGYVRTIDLEIALRHQLDEQTRQLLQLLQTELPIRSAVECSARHSLLTGMVLLQTMQCSFGCVVNEQRRCLGFFSADQLREILLRRPPSQKTKLG